MWEQILNVAISNGIFACLFVALLVYELKDSRTRENKYQNVISSLTKRMAVVEDIKQDVEEIKNVVVFEGKESKNEKIKKKLKSYSFWTALSASVVVLCTQLGKLLGIAIPTKEVEGLIMAVCGVLVALGIVCMPMEEKNKEQTSENTETNNQEAVEEENKKDE